MSDKDFDLRLNNLVGEAFNTGVHPAIILKCLCLTVADVYKNVDKNIEAAKKAKEIVSEAIEHNGKIPSILKSGTPPGIAQPPDNDMIYFPRN